MSAPTMRARVAALSGRELMTAKSQPQPWDWVKILSDPEMFHSIIGKLILLIGKTETGKSYWIRDFLHRARFIFPYGLIISHTKHNGFYQQFFPNHLIIPRFDARIVRRIIDLQKSRWGDRGRNCNFILIMDDIASEKLQHIQVLHEIAMEGRHYGITSIFTTQKFTSSITHIRQNARWNVLFTTTNDTVLDLMNKELANDFESREHWDAFVDLNTRDHHCVIIDQNPYLRGIKRYYTYKARDDDEIPPFVMLNDRAWGGDRHELVKKQRKQFRAAPKYSKSYLERMFTHEVAKKEEAQGHTDRYDRATKFDFYKMLT